MCAVGEVLQILQEEFGKVTSDFGKEMICAE